MSCCVSWGRHAHSAIRRSDAVLPELRPIMPTNEQVRVRCRRIKASDREAFANVFEALHDPWVRDAFQIMGKEAAAQDINSFR